MDKIKENTFLTRRGFMQAASAIAMASTFAGCSSSDGEAYYIGGSDSDIDITIPADEKTYGTCMGNNCGGKCIVRAHVQGGIIKRITTDESYTTDDITNPQKRACLKCRGKRTELYKPDRLLYPLRQDGERGDLSGFVRITWEEAFTEIAKKFKEATAEGYTGTDTYYHNNSANYGMGTVCAPFGGGITHFFAGHNFARKIASTIATPMPYNGSAMSYPQTNYVDQFTQATGDVITCPNGRADIFNCKHLVLWGFNPADSIMDTNTTYLLLQARDKGIPMTVIDPLVSRTSRMLGAKHLAPVAGTDPALVCGMLYHLIKLQLKETPVTNGKYLDFNFIKKATHGFFDLPSPVVGTGKPSDSDFYPVMTYMGATGAAADPEKYRVPAGASFSAYILGTDTDLVTAGYNSAPSIYPETIGYNVNSAAEAPDGVADPLYGKRVPIYGQVPKTPEWASYITGVPAEDIKNLAETIALTKYVGLLTGWGSNRTIEGEQSPWAINSFAMALGLWGETGRFWGSTHMPQSPYALGAPSMSSSSISAPAAAANIVKYRRYNSNKTSFRTVRSDNHGQMCTWADNIVNGGTGKSRWNDPAIKYTPELRTLFCVGYNPVNQAGDNKYAVEAIKNPKVKLVVTTDIFMSPKAQYSDYILPAKMQLEMDSFATSKESVINIPKLVNAPGECLSDPEIAQGIATAIDPKFRNTILSSVSEQEYNRKAFLGAKANAALAGLEDGDMTYDEYRAKGYISLAVSSKESAVNKWMAAYRSFIQTDGASGNAMGGLYYGIPGMPTNTTSGKMEIYCQAMMEDYEARRWYNFDNDASRYTGYTAADLRLKDWSGTYPTEGIYSKACEYKDGKNDDVPTTPNYDDIFLSQMNSAAWLAAPAEKAAKMMSARFVYPIPMYIPLAEGVHGCDDSADYMYNGTDMRHPDPMNLRGAYPYVMGNHHSIRHAHSCGDQNPLATEVYKLNKAGNAFRGLNNQKQGAAGITSGKGFMPSGELDVYEPLEISADDALALDLKTGDTILVTSPRGAALMAAYVSKAIRPGTTNMAEGAWSSFMDCKITFAGGTAQIMNVDVAGSANTLATARPSRICQGSGYCAYQRISIRKVDSVELV